MGDGEQCDGWRFGPDPFELYAAQRRLMRAGRVVELTPIEMSLLLILVENAPDIVSKQDFINFVWAGQPVGDGTIKSNICNLREHIGKTLIENHHGTGYRLTCRVEPINTPEELHARYLTALFVRADAQRQSMPDMQWDQLYLQKLPEVRSALDWTLATTERQQLAIALAGATGRLWERASLTADGRRYLDLAVSLINDHTPANTAAKCLRYAAILWRESNRPKALSLLERSLTIYRQLKDLNSVGSVLALIGGEYLHLGRTDEAFCALKEAENILSIKDQTKALLNCLNSLGSCEGFRKNIGEARDYYNRARDLGRMLGDPVREYVVVMNLGELEFCQGALDRAIVHAGEAIQGLQSSPSSYRVRPLVNLATYHAISGDLRSARAAATQAIELAKHGSGYWLRLCLQTWSYIAARSGNFSTAARILGFVDEQFLRFGEIRQLPEERLYSKLVRVLDGYPDRESIEVWQSEGRNWNEAQAVEAVVSLALLSGGRRARLRQWSITSKGK